MWRVLIQSVESVASADGHVQFDWLAGTGTIDGVDGERSWRLEVEAESEE